MPVTKAKTTKLSRDGSAHPFANQDPKPTRARLVSLLDPLGRKRYAEVERFLATVKGATSGLFFYPNEWGWAVRYMISTKTELCTLHLLPNTFEATLALGSEVDSALGAKELSMDLKRRISRAKKSDGARWVRLPIRSDQDFSNFKDLITVKAEAAERAEAEKPKTAKATKTGCISARAKISKISRALVAQSADNREEKKVRLAKG